MEDKRFKQLINSTRWSLQKLEPYRKRRFEAIQQYTGKMYGDEYGSIKVPLNMIEMAVTVYMQHLAAKRPSILVGTKFPTQKRMALGFEAAMSQKMKEIRIERVFQDSVMNALFGIGCIKTGDGVAETRNWDDIRDDAFLSRLAGEGNPLVITEPYAESIDLDDLVFDMGARTLEECRFIGHRYRILKEELAESLPSKKRDKLKARSREEDPNDRVEDIGKGGELDPEPFDEMVECYEMYLPYEQSVVTFQIDGDCDLSEVEYDGPNGGNYHFLSFHRVPNNIMPISPVNLWIHLHRLANNLFNKLGDQAERQKTVNIFDKTSSPEAENIHRAKDGETVAGRPSDVEGKSFGGPDAVNHGFLNYIQDQFSYFAGNLDLLGGLGPQSATLGQDELLAGSASKRIMDMQTSVMSHYEEVLKSLGWYVWNDELYSPALKRDLGAGVSEHLSFTPEDRSASDIIFFDFDLVPFSMTHDSPSAKWQKVMAIVQGVYMPMAQQALQQGVALDMKEVFKQAARLNNMEDILPELLSYADPSMAAEMGSGGGSSPPVKRTENVRTNRSGATPGGTRKVMARNLMGAGAQESELASAY